MISDPPTRGTGSRKIELLFCHVFKSIQPSSFIMSSIVIVKSVYIPHVFANIALDTVVSVLETQFCVGKVCRVESIPKVNQKDHHAYYSCFVYFSEWSASESAKYLDYQFDHDQQTKMYYSTDRYWVICKNNSDLRLSVHEQPKHMSLVTTIPSDVSVEAVYAVVEALDLGKVHSIQYSANVYPVIQLLSINDPTSSPLPRPVVTTMRDVYINYDFWYRTRSATAFQKTMMDDQSVQVHSASDGGLPASTWTFYETVPITEGINPHVWERQT